MKEGGGGIGNFGGEKDEMVREAAAAVVVVEGCEDGGVV